MQALLAISRAIDWINARLGIVACWLVLIAGLAALTVTCSLTALALPTGLLLVSPA